MGGNKTRMEGDVSFGDGVGLTGAENVREEISEEFEMMNGFVCVSS
jgi:hypothetical protein